MARWTISKWELKNTLGSKKFVTIFLAQLVVLFIMGSFFTSFMTDMSTEDGINLNPSLKGFGSLDINDSHGLFTKNINPEILKIKTANPTSYDSVKNGKINGLILTKSITENNLQKIDYNLVLDYSDPKSIVVKTEVESASNKTSKSITQDFINKNKTSQNSSTKEVKEEATGIAVPIQLINKIMTALLLFLPVFLFGNLVIDSIVSEKERKTGEILIAMPISRSNIVLGKSFGILCLMSIQLFLWIIIMTLTGFDLVAPALIYLLVVLTAIPIVGVGTVVAVFSKNYKESEIGSNFAYLITITILVIPALVSILRPGMGTSSTISLVIKIFSREALNYRDIFNPIITVVVLSVITYGLSVWMYNKDEIIFGPRPKIITSILNFLRINKIIKKIKGEP